MKLVVAKEANSFEHRSAISPDTVAEYLKLGFTVELESSLGDMASFNDKSYEAKGAKIVDDIKSSLKDADILLSVSHPAKANLKKLKSGAIVITTLFNDFDDEVIEICAKQNLSLFAMEFIPRITRAQSMDVLSSMSNLAGYKAVIDAVANFSKAVPMMMTAAGTIHPAKILILGAGVAGLQAIATARRLGAIVSAFDVRPAAKEQVESLGATFVAVESEETADAETKGGYAKEMSENYKKKQADLIAEKVKENDIIISTALIPGKPAPRLITEKMVESMARGSVIVDLATGSGGNCSLSVKDKIIVENGVTIIGYSNFPSRVSFNATKLFAKNLANFVALIKKSGDSSINLDFEDEIIKSTVITHGGQVLHQNFIKGSK